MIATELFVTISDYLHLDDLKRVSLITREINTLFGNVGLLSIIAEYESVRTSDNVFIEACKRGYIHLVEYLCKSYNSFNRPLRAACENGHLDIVKCLHENGANLLGNDYDSIEIASYKGHLDIVKYLHENGVDIFDDLIKSASADGHLDVVKYLHQNGASLDFAINYSLERGHLSIIKYAYENGVNMVKHNAVIWACLNEQFDIVKYLHDIGMVVPLQDLIGQVYIPDDLYAYLKSR